jgi:hypothetical protein
MRAAPDSYGNLLATRQRNERVFAFGYSHGSEPVKSGCERTKPTGTIPSDYLTLDAAIRPAPNLIYAEC